MSDSVARIPRSVLITIFAAMTRAVEWGFLAAGITIAVLAAFQSIDIGAGWLGKLEAAIVPSWVWIAAL